MHDAPESQNGLPWVDSERVFFFFSLLKINGFKHKNRIQAFEVLVEKQSHLIDPVEDFSRDME